MTTEINRVESTLIRFEVIITKQKTTTTYMCDICHIQTEVRAIENKEKHTNTRAQLSLSGINQI